MIQRLFVVIAFALLAGCGSQVSRTANGYVEGEYVYVAAPEGGWVTEVLVQRGASVKVGDALFLLDAEVQTAQRDQAAAGLEQAKAQLANLQKGRRPDEKDALAASVAQAEASLKLAEAEYARATNLREKQFVSQSFLDARRSQRDAARQVVAQARANLRVASLGARDDEIVAAKAAVKVSEATLARAEYALSQRRIPAKVAGKVEDIIRRKGEFVSPGGPVLQILPPENLKIRFFVPEQLRSKVKTGQTVRVTCDGCGEKLQAKISFLSSTAEYTPPVIFSTGSREKLVWLVEARPEKGVYLSPGQPVDVVLP